MHIYIGVGVRNLRVKVIRKNKVTENSDTEE